VKKETREQLELFRQQQEDAERKALEQVQWAAPARKRKKGPESTLLKGVKLRKSSSTAEEKKPIETAGEEKKSTTSVQTGASAAPSAKAGGAPAALALGLGYGSSDEDE
jgi:hypothetical protein